jgi:hypothetical protein
MSQNQILTLPPRNRAITAITRALTPNARVIVAPRAVARSVSAQHHHHE